MDVVVLLGIEMFVLDDGWFGYWNDDNSLLGDWFVNWNKLLGGLVDISKWIYDKGMWFGFWFELENILVDFDFYWVYFDWVLGVLDCGWMLLWNEYVFDFS